MEALQTAIVETLGQSGPALLVGALGFLMILLTLPIFLKREKDPLDKLKNSARGLGNDISKSDQLRSGSSRDKLEKYSDFLEPKDAEEYSAVKLKLLQAGYRGKNAVRTFHFLQFAFGMFGLLLGAAIAIYRTIQGEVTSQDLAVTVLAPAVIGYMAPRYWVTRRQNARKLALENAFPDSLDLMLVCVEAGQSLDQAILRVANELKAGFPEMAEEYETVSQELKAGKEKTSVLKDMGERCGNQDITSFVTVLVQSQQFGTSIADALRVYSSEMRDKRIMRAEEKANKLPVKMTLATMMFTVPPLLLILVGPSVYAIVVNLSNNGSG